MGMPDPSRPGGIVKRQRPRSLAPFRIAGSRGVPLAIVPPRRREATRHTHAAAGTDYFDYRKR